MKEYDLDLMTFFDGRRAAYPLYRAFEAALLARHPDTKVKVGKTQITFANRRVYACASFLHVRRKADMPDPYIVITLGLPGPPLSARVAVQTEPYPGRWTHHIVAASEGDVDDELLGWVQQAYDFAARK